MKGPNRMAHPPSWVDDGGIVGGGMLIGQLLAGEKNSRRLMGRKRLATACCILPSPSRRS